MYVMYLLSFSVYLQFGCALTCYSGAAAASGRALSGGGSKESEGEIDRVKDSEDAIFHSKTSSPLKGVTNENGGHVHSVSVQVSIVHGD